MLLLLFENLHLQDSINLPKVMKLLTHPCQDSCMIVPAVAPLSSSIVEHVLYAVGHHSRATIGAVP